MFDSSARLFLRFRGKVTGPYSLAQIEQMRQLGRMTAFHEVSLDGTNWFLAVDAGLVTSTSMGQTPTAELSAMSLPTESATPASPPWYHLDASGGRQGPIPSEQMAELVTGGKFTGSSEVWCEGFPDWVPLAQTELAAFLPQKPIGVANDPTTQDNGLVVAGYLLCVPSLFLPPLGILALICAIVNLTRRRVSHGLAQLFLSIVLSSAGSLLAYLVWQEINKQ